MKFIFFLLFLLTFSIHTYPQSAPVIRMRCYATISENQALWIVVLKKKSYILNHSPERLIRPETVENIKILKNAEATALYGVRAVNGVVVVTIKKSKSREEYKRLKPYFEKA